MDELNRYVLFHFIFFFRGMCQNYADFEKIVIFEQFSINLNFTKIFFIFFLTLWDFSMCQNEANLGKIAIFDQALIK